MSSQSASRPADGGGNAPDHLNTTSATAMRTLRILKYLGQTRTGRSVKEICDALGMQRHAVDRALKGLEAEDLAAKAKLGRGRHGETLWVVGVGAIRLARAAGGPIREVAPAAMRELADTFQLTATLFAATDQTCLALDSIEPLNPTAASYGTGRSFPLTAVAPGIAILASGPPHPDEPHQVAVARKNGYATTTDQIQPGLTDIAAPIWGLPGEPARYSLSLTGPTEHLTDRLTDLGVALIQHANQIAERLL